MQLTVLEFHDKYTPCLLFYKSQASVVKSLSSPQICLGFISRKSHPWLVHALARIYSEQMPTFGRVQPTADSN